MIEKIYAINFKGLTFEQSLDQYTLFVGPNGAGKSARTQALTLAILGYLPHDQKKKAGDIYETHSAGAEFAVGFTLKSNGNKERIERTWINHKGSISQEIRRNGKKLQQRQVEKVLMEIGDPRILDLKALMELSDQKKIDYIFDLFPPDIDIEELSEEIGKLTERANAIYAKLRAIDSTIERLSRERSLIELPAGTMPEIQAEINEKERQLDDAKEQLKQIWIEEKEESTKKRMLEESKEKVKKLQDKLDFAEKELKEKKLSKFPEKSKADEMTLAQTADIVCDLTGLLETISKVGCEACAARIIIKSLISKYKKETHNG